MTVETHEDEARRVVMEVSRRSVTVTAHLAHTTWLEVRQFLGQRLAGTPREPRLGRRVSPKELELATRGQRESVNLTDPRVARLVQRELNRYGVTFAITRDAEGVRVHIGAGNATQLDTAMRHAEQTLARQLAARQARQERRAGLEDATREDHAQERTAAGPGGGEERSAARTQEAPPRRSAAGESAERGAEGPTGPGTDERYVAAARKALPAPLAQAVIAESAWPVLAESLAAAEDAGLDPAAVLGSVVGQRETFTSRSVAAVLAWRVDGAVAQPSPRLAQERPAERAEAPVESGPEAGRDELWASPPRTSNPGPGVHATYQATVRKAQLPPQITEELLSDPHWRGLATGLIAARERGGNPVELLERAVNRGPAPAGHRLGNTLGERVDQQSRKDAREARAAARSASVPSVPERVQEGLPAPAPGSSPWADLSYGMIVQKAQLPSPLGATLLGDKHWGYLDSELRAAMKRGGNPIELLQRAANLGPLPAGQPVTGVLGDRVREASSKDAQKERTVARSALNERARALPKGDVVDLATEKPGRGLDLGGPRR